MEYLASPLFYILLVDISSVLYSIIYLNNKIKTPAKLIVTFLKLFMLLFLL